MPPPRPSVEHERLEQLEREVQELRLQVQILSERLEPDPTVQASCTTWAQLQHRVRNFEAWLQQCILTVQQATGAPEPRWT